MKIPATFRLAGWRWRGGYATLLLSSALRLAAQNSLYVADGGGTSYRMVHDVWRGDPVVVRDGKYVRATDHRYAFKRVDEFLPAFVAIRNVEAESVEIQGTGGGDSLYGLRMTARFESLYHLQHVFAVLEILAGDGNSYVVVQSIAEGELKPRKVKKIDVGFPFWGPITGNYQLHLFADGREVLTSQIPQAARERALDQMVLNRIANLPDGPPKPFVVAPPEYPAGMRETDVPGKALIRLRVASSGRAFDPQIVSASDPAFGASALAAMGQWRFLPKIEHSAPVESVIVLPVDFAN